MRGEYEELEKELAKYRLEDIAKYEERAANRARYELEKENRAIASAALLVQWNEKIQPILDELGWELESQGSGYEVEGSAIILSVKGDDADVSTIISTEGDYW